MHETEPVDKEDLLFVFEVVRHGARAPFAVKLDDMPEPVEMLTPMGMRQRFLLGRYFYQRYGHLLEESDEHQKEHDDLFSSRNLFVQSTDVYRTIQSGYSELQGFHHEKAEQQRPKLSERNVHDLKHNGQGMPAFNVRRAKQIDEDLKEHAIVRGYSGLPIYAVVKDDEWTDDLGRPACPFANEVNAYRYPRDYAYSNALWLRDAMRDNYAKEFNLTEDQRVNMTFNNANGYSDALHSMIYEGIPTKINYTETEQYYINHTQKFSLVDPYTSKARKLYSSKTLEKPLSDMLELENVIKGEST